MVDKEVYLVDLCPNCKNRIHWTNILEGYECSKCGSVYEEENKAEKCCKEE